MAHHHDTAAHEHGTMEVRDQEKTFAGFIRFSTWFVIIVALVLVFLALTGT